MRRPSHASCGKFARKMAAPFLPRQRGCGFRSFSSLRTAPRIASCFGASRLQVWNSGSQAAIKKRTNGPPRRASRPPCVLVRVAPPHCSQMNNSCSNSQSRLTSARRPPRAGVARVCAAAATLARRSAAAASHRLQDATSKARNALRCPFEHGPRPLGVAGPHLAAADDERYPPGADRRPELPA